MRRMHYAGGSIVVGDEVARAIEGYALVLARLQSADIVTLPANSSRDRIELVLGPSSQLFSEEAEGPLSDEGDELILADIRARQRDGGAHAQPEFETEPAPAPFDDFDL